MSRGATVSVASSRRSASVDLPWSMWAMIEKLRIRSWGMRAAYHQRMASVEGERRRPKPSTGAPEKRALVLAGGGIVGVTYEIGALRALDDLLVGTTVNDFDIYVGTSAGSWVTSLLVNGVTPTEMALSLEGTNPGLDSPSRWTIYRPNVGEMAKRMLRLP